MRLINEQDVFDIIDDLRDQMTVEGYWSMVERVKALSSAQPEIVACGDCKHWICHDRRCGYWNHGVKPLDWCCHGERRTDE